jgi:hypothetical protein
MAIFFAAEHRQVVHAIIWFFDREHPAESSRGSSSSTAIYSSVRAYLGGKCLAVISVSSAGGRRPSQGAEGDQRPLSDNRYASSNTCSSTSLCTVSRAQGLYIELVSWLTTSSGFQGTVQAHGSGDCQVQKPRGKLATR